MKFRISHIIRPLILIFILCFLLLGTQHSFAQNDAFSKVTGGGPVTSTKCNEFTFDATGSYDPDSNEISFFWDFGDGFTSTEPVVTHIYEQSGDYQVLLRIEDNSGVENSFAETSQLIRTNIPPFAVIDVPDKVCIDQPINFDGSGSYDDVSRNLNYKWDFGDGSTAFGSASTSKTYKKEGLYTVRLTVDDNSKTVCSSHTADKFVYVNAPPVADAGKEEILRCVESGSDFVVSFDGSNSKDPNGDPLMYLWDFGDGFTYEGISTNHRYEDVGTYDVQLIVSDSSNIGCGKNIDFVKVKLNVAPEADAGEDVVGCPGESIEFDGTGSYIHQPGTDISKWFFGDGITKDGLHVSHTYHKPGKYQASLTVENKLNSMCPSSRDTKVVNINSVPMVALKTPDTICLGESIQFDASSAADPDGDALEYYWSFGDGEILKAGPVVNHQYQRGGKYRVSVTVDDNKGTACSTATAEQNVTVNTPPIADPGPNLACCVDIETTFSATASSDPDGDNLTYQWDLGDGKNKNGAVVEHTYGKSGAYNVTLTVDDNTGTSCSKVSAGFVAQINATPIPKIDVR